MWVWVPVPVAPRMPHFFLDDRETISGDMWEELERVADCDSNFENLFSRLRGCGVVGQGDLRFQLYPKICISSGNTTKSVRPLSVHFAVLIDVYVSDYNFSAPDFTFLNLGHYSWSGMSAGMSSPIPPPSGATGLTTNPFSDSGDRALGQGPGSARPWI